MKRILTCILLLSALNTSAQKLLTSNYPRQILERALAEPGAFNPVPAVGSSKAWHDGMSESVKASYIRLGEQFRGKPWASLPASEFAKFKQNGNRTGYETLCFKNREQLAALVMAEAAERKGRFIGDIVNGLQNLCEETWWGLPAHYSKMLPQPEEQTVDLFNAETAAMAAWTRYILGEQLDRLSPLICRRIDSEVNRRMLQPALAHDYWWKKAGSNWNPWITSCWLASVLFCEHDRQRQLNAVSQILACLDAFIDAYPADGGCDEGAGYWDRAAGSLYEALYLLKAATGGAIDLSTNQKVKAMMAYIYKMYIGNGYFVDFADTHQNRWIAQPNLVYPMAHYFADPAMKAFAADMLTPWHQDAAEAYRKSGNWPTLGRELVFAAMMVSTPPTAPTTTTTTTTSDHWLPDLQIMIARRGELFVAMKGGTNGESHNHNDVGSFIVYADNQPLIIDPAAGEYTAKTFGKDRYTIWTMQSAYHSLPLINGTMQNDGKQYAARTATYRKGALQLDIAGAYPPEAAVDRWTRRVSIGKAVQVTESYELSAWKAPTQLMFVAVAQPAKLRPGCIAIGNRRMTYDPQQLSADIENISTLLDPALRQMWGQNMYRIVLTVNNKKLKGKINYTIQ